jgi:hypothetical protein
MNMNVFAKYTCDDLDRVVEAATKENAPDQIRVINQLAQKGNDFWRLWAEAAGGGMLEEGFGCGLVQFPASKLGEVARQSDQYTYLLGMTISVGVGKSLEEVEQALKLAQKRGGNQLVLFTEETLQELAGHEASEKVPLFDENDKVPADGLSKSFSKDGVISPTKQNYDVSEEGPAKVMASYQNPEQEHTHTVQNFQTMRNKLREHAQKQEHSDNISRMKNSEDLSQLKTKVATVLQNLKDQLPALAGLKTTNPDAYQAVLALVQSVISLGKQLSDTDKQLAKAEELSKGMGEMPNYPGFGTESIGLNKKDLLPGGQADNMSPVEFDAKDLDEGTQHELEHTTDKDLAREIAMDHLAEDPDYYKKLKDIEKAGDKETSQGKVKFKFGKVHIRRHLKLPVGTLLNGRMKVRHYDGSVGWVSVRGGMAMSNTDPTGHPVSAKKPNAK